MRHAFSHTLVYRTQLYYVRLSGNMHFTDFLTMDAFKLFWHVLFKYLNLGKFLPKNETYLKIDNLLVNKFPVLHFYWSCFVQKICLKNMVFRRAFKLFWHTLIQETSRDLPRPPETCRDLQRLAETCRDLQVPQETSRYEVPVVYRITLCQQKKAGEG